MSKSDFIENIAKRHSISKADAKRIVGMVFKELISGMKELKKSKKFAVGTIGTFYIVQRKARHGRNPRTGEPIKIKATSVLKFRPSIHLKKAAGVSKK